jgi:hypothetical protein
MSGRLFACENSYSWNYSSRASAASNTTARDNDMLDYTDPDPGETYLFAF